MSLRTKIVAIGSQIIQEESGPCSLKFILYQISIFANFLVPVMMIKMWSPQMLYTVYELIIITSYNWGIKMVKIRMYFFPNMQYFCTQNWRLNYWQKVICMTGKKFIYSITAYAYSSRSCFWAHFLKFYCFIWLQESKISTPVFPQHYETCRPTFER